ncbi:MAG: 3-deoxy-manno-octulosonate cytidylyltransferase [Bacteroidota bacterium]
MPTLAVIPARYASTRLPAKPLADLGGKPLIWRVYEAVQACSQIDRIIVATDDERIKSAVENLGGECMLTSQRHQSGTDRIAEVSALLPAYEYVLNVQGDEPFIQASQLEAIIQLLQEGAQIATMARRIQSDEALFSNQVVKLVLSDQSRALYFSRSPVPNLRDEERDRWLDQKIHLQHLGLYGFDRQTLYAITKLPVSPLEEAEKLEQLRWLQAGFPIAVTLTDHYGMGIDTPEDLEKAKIFFE